MRIRWSEKAKRLIKGYCLDFDEVESGLLKSSDHTFVHVIENGGKRIVFTIDDENNIDAEIKLW